MKQISIFLAAAILAVLGFAAVPAHAGPFLDELRASLGNLGDGSVATPDGKVAAATPLPGRSIFKYRRQTVTYASKETPGTIVVDTGSKFLYYVLGDGRAIRYGIGVGREGFGWHGVVRVGRKAEWPAWRPPAEMIERERRRGKMLPTYVEGGPGNPLGARALYLYQGFADNGYRIHGTTEPWSIGRNVSSGCIRMVNPDVIDLFNRTKVGTKVIVL